MVSKAERTTNGLYQLSSNPLYIGMGVILFYLLAGFFKLNVLLTTILAFPAVYIMPGLFLLFLMNRGRLPGLRQLLVESFFLSTVFNVLLSLLFVLFRIPLTTDTYSIFMVLFLVVMLASFYVLPKSLVAKSDRTDYFLVFITVLVFVFLTICLSYMPRSFAPDETDYIFNARGILNEEVYTMGVGVYGSDLSALLSGRLFWTFLLASFLAATGLQPSNAYLIGPAFYAMTALALTLLVPDNLNERGKLRLVISLLILTNPLLIMFSGLGALNDLAITFYVSTAVAFFAKSFAGSGNKFSLEITWILKTLAVLLVVTLIKPNLLIILGIWLWFIYIGFRYKVYKVAIGYKLLFVFLVAFPLAYEVLIDIPYVVSYWFLKNEVLAKFYYQFAFISPLELFLSAFAAPPWKMGGTTFFTQEWTYYSDSLYTIIAPEGLGLPLSALALVLPATLLLKRVRENLQLRTTIFVTEISLVVLYVIMIGVDAGLSAASRYSLWIVPLLILIATISLYELFSNLSTRALFLLHIPMFILLGINYILSMTRGGVIFGWGTPRFASTYVPLALMLFSYAVLVTLLTLTKGPNPRVKLRRKKEAVMKVPSVNARQKAFYVLITILIFSNLYFSYSLISYSIGFTDHGLNYMAALVDEYAENKAVVANNYIYLRLYLSDKRLFNGLVLPLPSNESEFLDLLKMVPSRSVLLVTDDAFVSYGFGNEYIKKFSEKYTIMSHNSSLSNPGPAYALRIYRENLPYGKLNLYTIINSKSINDGRGNVTVNDARILVQDNEIILNLNVSSLTQTNIFTFIRAEDGRFLKAYNTSLQTGNNDVKYSFDINSPHRYAFSLSQPRVFVIDNEGHIVFNQVVYRYNIKLIEVGLTAIVAMMLCLYLFSNKRFHGFNEYMDSFSRIVDTEKDCKAQIGQRT